MGAPLTHVVYGAKRGAPWDERGAIVYEGHSLEEAAAAWDRAVSAVGDKLRPSYRMGDSAPAVFLVDVEETRAARFAVVAENEKQVRRWAREGLAEEALRRWGDTDTDTTVKRVTEFNHLGPAGHVWLDFEGTGSEDLGEWIKGEELLGRLAKAEREARLAAEAERRRELGYPEPVPVLEGQEPLL